MVQANYDGSSRQYVVSPDDMRTMGLNLAELIVGLRIDMIDTNAGVTAKLQYSLDGQTWNDGASPLVTEKTATGDYVGSNSTSTELLPNLRVALVVRDMVGSNQLTARVSVWAYYLYRV